MADLARGACPAADGAEGMADIPRLTLKSLRVEPDRVVAEVLVGNPRRADTTEQLARAATKKRPDLLAHACVNGVGPTFAAVIGHTPLPHLLEHVVVDLQVASCQDPNRVFTGVTRWIDRSAGLARVEVSYADDIACLRAFRDAVELINGL